MSVLRAINGLLSPRGPGARLTIMIFHRVPLAPDPLLRSEPDQGRFRRIMRHVRRWFDVLPLEEAAVRLVDGSLPPRALSITFDDGYADNCQVALPLLAELRLPATFFVASGYLDGGCMWNDVVIETLRRFRGTELDLRELGLPMLATGSIEARRAAVATLLDRLKYEPQAVRRERVERIAALAQVEPPRDLMMSSAQVRTLADAGMTIGAHTRAHPILATLDLAAAREEMAGSRRDLEQIIQRPVRLFAYPNGKPGRDFTREHVALARELGFAAACSTASGTAGRGADLFQLPRFTPWDRAPWKFGMRLTRNLRQTRYAMV